MAGNIHEWVEESLASLPKEAIDALKLEGPVCPCKDVGHTIDAVINRILERYHRHECFDYTTLELELERQIYLNFEMARVVFLGRASFGTLEMATAFEAEANERRDMAEKLAVLIMGVNEQAIADKIRDKFLPYLRVRYEQEEGNA